MRADKETKALNKQMKEILEMADFVKFAKMRPMPEDNEAAMRKAVNFVEDTRPVEVAEPEKSSDDTPTVTDATVIAPTAETSKDADNDFEKYGPSNKNRL